jgi:hypothetical protein
MAPPYLEKEILEFANQPETADLAVKSLARIPTASSRESLIALYDRSKDLALRVEIVQQLAGVATPVELSFFASLLPDRSTPLEDQSRVWAVLGLGRLGGPRASSRTRHHQPQLRSPRGAYHSAGQLANGSGHPHPASPLRGRIGQRLGHRGASHSYPPPLVCPRQDARRSPDLRVGLVAPAHRQNHHLRP